MLYRKKALGRLSLGLVFASLASTAFAEASLPTAGKPEEVGLNSAQLKRIEAVTKTNIDQGYVPGAIMLVARKGKIAWTSVQGKLDGKSDTPMKMDAIFRIYSMTKPIVSVALMQMVEEGKLQVSDPVAKYLPELANMKVGVQKTGADGKPYLDLVAPASPMTVQDLLRHTSGLSYGNRGTSLVHQAYGANKIGDRSFTNAEFITQLAKVPLVFNPGERWDYSVSVDVQGRLLEVLSGGKPLAEVLAERVTGPLGMTDTTFWVPQDKMNRVAQATLRPNGPPLRNFFDYAERAKFQGGGGSMVGTTEDYVRFTMMLANGGEFQGKRLLGKKTVEFMAADHVGARPGRPAGLGFGLGFEVRTKPESALPGSVGEYGWSGAAGTMFWIDPKEQLIALYMVQANDVSVNGSEPDTRYLRNQFRSMVQASVID
jgi:CubicO group peptidase (beta-lactamase class C family)